jgi:hypothetical protein
MDSIPLRLSTGRPSWSQTGTQVPNNGTWSLGSKADHACPRFWWWNPRHECFVAAISHPEHSGTAGREQAGGRDGHNGRVIDELIARMKAMLGPLEASGDQRRYFHATYQRTTIAVADQIKRGGFADPEWVERWDVAFADLYLDALETAVAGQRPARPWDIAFSAPADLPALRHVLLGMNAHINYDLPQALLAVITDEEFGDAALLARREADHQAIDGVLASRVGAEDDELARLSGPPPLLDRLLRPFNRLGTQRFLREARVKVWANAITLNRARRQGPDAYAARLAQLEELSAAKVAELQAPGQVLLKLAATGFGVRLSG